MCGIAGIFLRGAETSPSKLVLTKMIKEIEHRGPDALKIWTTDGIGLAHARLSIIDLDSSADQPMFDNEHGLVIVFNGEIYNYIELKQELSILGHQFTTKSDTEVILKSYAQWGVDCLNKFNGMWAMAIYDQRKKQLFCARDRLGVKPLIYGITSKHDIVFASEAKAIVENMSEFKQVNSDFLLNFIERDFFACYKKTFYKHLFNLLPGHYFLVKMGEEPKQIRYWTWTPEINLTYSNEGDIKSRFNNLFMDAIKLRFRSDVPVGACLSGGLDSSTIVGVASSLFNQRIQTFSCVYPNSPAYDESDYIQSSVNKFNTISKFVEPSHDDFISLMQASIYEQDGPTGGPSILSQRAVMKLASQDVKVILDGQGADEILGGYHSYFRYSLLSQIRNFSKNKNLLTFIQYCSNLRKIKQRCGSKMFNFFELMAAARKPVSFYTDTGSDSLLRYFKAFDGDDLNTVLLEHVFTNLTNLLHYEDRNSMRFSIESRLPFLDYRIVEFAFSLPARFKIRGSTTKWLLNSIAKDILPTNVLHRKDKMGYSTPAHKWFLQDENINYFQRYLSPTNPIYESLSQFMRGYLLNSFKLLSAHKNTPPPGLDINALWRFFTANMWNEGEYNLNQSSCIKSTIVSEVQCE